jgi:hypothetical protein
VLRRSDLPSPSEWSGGPEQPSTAPFACRGFHPNEADLVVRGVAESAFRSGGFVFDSTAEVYATAAMAQLDWQRALHRPQTRACLRVEMTKGLLHGIGVHSFAPLELPLAGVEWIGYRLVLDVPHSTVRVLSDLVLTRAGRFEVDLSTTAPLDPSAARRRSEERTLDADEVTLVRRMLARSR